MKLHRLEITAFGPFAGSETVDFDALNDVGVFLLNGDTGSGKTSVLDAICFALYSEGTSVVSKGGRKSAKSDHADPATPPLVRLEYTAARRRWLIERSPQWNRPSSRAASGVTVQHARVVLYQWDGGAWIEVATRAEDVGQMVAQTVGLNREQFTQVMMLPQGRFERFLKAASGDREKLLETLFGTDIYRQVQEQLKERAKSAKSELASLESEQEHILLRTRELSARVARIRQATRDTASTPGSPHEQADTTNEFAPGNHRDTDPGFPTGQDIADIAENTTESLEQLAHEVKQTEQEVATAHSQASKRAEKASERHQRLVEQYKDLLRFMELEGQQQELAEQLPRIQSHTVALDLHHRAKALVRPMAVLAQCTTKTGQAHAVWKQAWDVLGAQGQEGGPYARALSENSAPLHAVIAGENFALGSLRDTVLSAQHGAQQAEKQEQELRALQNSRDTTVKLQQRAVTDHERAVHHLEDARAKISELTSQLNELESLEADPLEATRGVQQAQAVVEASRELERQQALVKQREEDYRVAEEERHSAVSHVEDLERRRFESAVTTLAAALEDGAPCPVCGAREHPLPALSRPGGEVTEVTLKEARDLRQHRQDSADQALESLRDARSAVDAAVARGALDNPQRALDLLATSQTHAAKVQATLTQLLQVKEELDRYGKREQEFGQQAAVLDVEAAGLHQRVDDLEQQIGELESALTREKYGFQTVAERKKATDELLGALDQLVLAQQDLHDATLNMETAQATVDGALNDAGFSTVTEAREALLEDAKENELARYVEDHARRQEEVRAELATPRMRAVADLDQHSKDVLTAQKVDQALRLLHDINAQRDDWSEALGVLRNVGHDIEAHRTRTAGHHARLTEARERFQSLDGLAAAANAVPGSENTLKMTLTSFVLAARLEQVAQIASEHLLQMSSGRFSIVHTDQGSGGGKAGLGLEIDDNWTGVRRGTETLSGGESFYTSLALALGLADVVRSEAGGHDMDTLFVDEGFGSLDEDTLEQVLETIEGLRRHGRVIGLVSHVAEMKQRIDAQIVVTKTPTGSHLSVTRSSDLQAGAA